MLLLAVDANFRLKNRMWANEIDDPSLGPGWGYWVEPKGYKRHIKKYVNEKDVGGFKNLTRCIMVTAQTRSAHASPLRLCSKKTHGSQQACAFQEWG
jgi:hypothetical protein